MDRIWSLIQQTWFNTFCLFIYLEKEEICDMFKKNIYRVLKLVKLGLWWRFLEGGDV